MKGFEANILQILALNIAARCTFCLLVIDIPTKIAVLCSCKKATALKGDGVNGAKYW